jgi:hypothetical protein
MRIRYLKNLVKFVIPAAVLICIGFFLSQGCSGPTRHKRAQAELEKFNYIFLSYHPGAKANSSSEVVKTYIGSDSCKVCHNYEYKTWRKYFMSRFVRLRKDMRYIPGLYDLPSKYRDKADEVSLVVGGRNKIALVIRPWKVMPYQYHLNFQGKKARSWKYRPNWEMADDFRSRCGQCHLTGLDPTTFEFSELGVGCEACHGPGKRHVDKADTASLKIPKGNEACLRCHFQRLKHINKFEFSGKFHK